MLGQTHEIIPVIATITTTTTTAMTATTAFFVFAQTGTDGFWLRRGLRSEASNPRQLEVRVAAEKFKELLVHTGRFVDSWIKEKFVWILAAFVHGWYP